jgi:hypothetical protein
VTPGAGFGDRGWFEAWADAFAGSAPRHWLDLGGSRGPTLMLGGAVRICGIPRRVLSAPANSHTPRWGVALDAGDDADRLSAMLLAALRATGSAGFAWPLVPEESPTRAAVAALEASGRWVAEVRPAESCALIDASADWDTYYRARSRTLRKGIRLGEERLRGQGDLQFVRADETDDWLDWLHRLLALEKAGWKGQAGSAVAQHAEQQRFYERVCASARSRGALRLLVAILDKEPVAGLLSMVEDGIEYCLKTAYDERFSQHSPGHLVRRDVLQRAFADPAIRWIDLLGPVTDEKGRWATRTEWLSMIRLAPARGLTGWLLRAEMAGRRTKARLRAAHARDGAAPGPERDEEPISPAR